MTDDATAKASVPTLVLPENGNGHSPPPQPEGSVVIRLDADEEKLFQTLVEAADAFERGDIRLESQEPVHVNIRVAGGWVRDKLLSKHTHDVDIALDKISGVQFATLVQLYLKQKGEQVRHFGVIAANPSQSKHLETATMAVYSIEVDYVNLRGEVYETHSRIPTTTFGTPLQDAQRRDFTVNSLFFNLRSKQVEDWTGRGLTDLRDKLLVTPLCPHQTFHDDPLRVLRAIRFAVRYEMMFHPQLEHACRAREVHESLHLKISRERVGKELEAMLSGKSAKPQQALETIGELGLSDSVFCLAPQGVHGSIVGQAWIAQDSARLEGLGWEEAKRLMRLLPAVLQAHLALHSTVSTTTTEVDLRLVHLGVYLLPFRHLHYKDRKNKVHLVVEYMMKESIKFKNKDTNAMVTMMGTVDTMKDFLVTFSSCGNVRRLDAGLFLLSTRDLWVTCLLLATVLKLQECPQEEQRNGWIQASLSLYRTIGDLRLDECWNMRPILNGKEMIQALQLPLGPTVGDYLKEEQRWMLEHPQGTRQECLDHLICFKRELERQSLESSHHISKKMAVEDENGRKMSFSN